jgi:RNA polymerase sigma-70 factor (ECF subfamily)
MDKLSIIQNCLKENPVAQRKLFEIYAPKMMSVCLRYFQNVHEAEDVLQEGFIKIFKKINSFEKITSVEAFESWIRKIIVNVAIDHLRNNIKIGYNDNIESYDYKKVKENVTIENITADEMMELINQLQIMQRTVFNMFAIEGYTHKEIADLLNITEGASRTHYFRAKENLKLKLNKILSE